MKENKKNTLTTIAISRQNYLLLRRMGGTGESFNDVLTRLVGGQKNRARESGIGPSLA